MITAQTARSFQRKGQESIAVKWVRTRTFPLRYLASPRYREELIAEVDLLCDDQVNRIIDRLESLEDTWFDIGDCWPMCELDCEVRR